MQHPNILPTLRCLPDRDSGTPSFRESFPLAAESPLALFHDQESPNFLLRRPIGVFFWDDEELYMPLLGPSV